MDNKHWWQEVNWRLWGAISIVAMIIAALVFAWMGEIAGLMLRGWWVIVPTFIILSTLAFGPWGFFVSTVVLTAFAGGLWDAFCPEVEDSWLRGSWPLAVVFTSWAFAWWRWKKAEDRLGKALAALMVIGPIIVAGIYGVDDLAEAYRAHASGHPIPTRGVPMEGNTRLIRQSPANGECEPGETIHEVKRGEMLSTIAAKYEVDWRELHSHNHRRPVNPLPANPGRLEIGDIVCIP